MPKPKSIQIEERLDELVLTRKWLSGKFYFLMFFTPLWNGVLLFLFFSKDIPDFLSLYLSLHLCVGLGLIYYTIAGLINTATITASRSSLTVKHGPMPWFGNKKEDTGDIEQLFVRQKINKYKNREDYTYVLYALTKNNRKIKILKGIECNNDTDVLYLEYQIEKWLGIEDRQVLGEHKQQPESLSAL